MSRRNFNPVALAAVAPLSAPHFYSADATAIPPSRAAVPEATPAVRLVRQQGVELIQFNANDIPGLSIVQAQNIELPGVLETSGQITYDDRSTSTIVSRVQGRIEQTRVSLWDNVQRGEKIVALYSPDFMTAESEYLQAHESSKLIAAPGVGGSSDFAGALSHGGQTQTAVSRDERCRHPGHQGARSNGLDARADQRHRRRQQGAARRRRQSRRRTLLARHAQRRLDHRRHLRGRSRARARRPGAVRGNDRISRRSLPRSDRPHQSEYRSHHAHASDPLRGEKSRRQAEAADAREGDASSLAPARRW